ncbi:Thiol-disulfide oxidoreductase ResA [Gemmata obscuriglobus]|uniref:redoxin family protein n=1 Tax=Gemmata obscuriglobus TaxID=114 RepID=UPI00016C4323|nr:redoxin family protein [Gemmata obscuriglobus]QEG27442.1 Thiol-disulfide oxidoreductase ResA [Gemmata obscuriglobus]VTS04403.1 thiol-disulfide oxidoreductase : Thiol-disulfide isomerase-like thioredoxin OS=Singulisphaera acidiphila (strain ATCC BAA-1392 / DSM 18658 / VKM B-2454 / MOB10) GN=Sinac_2770 PE=4 SV=1: Redoxin: Cu2_monoox_C [Gemmata obscuriglobus UQM 2246]
MFHRLSLVLSVAAVFSLTASAQDAAKIGERVGKITLTDIRALPRTLADFGERKALVLVFTNTTCPLAQRYLPTLKSLEKAYRDKGVPFVAVNAAEDDTLLTMATHAVKYEVEFPTVKDFGGNAARALGVKRTPEAVVLDAENKVRYRGRIDDQFRLGGSRKEPTKQELKDAIEAVLANKPVDVAETEVDGCPIEFAAPRKAKGVNFAEHVAPILKKHCWECHRSGGSAPFALTTAKQAAARAKSVAEAVATQRMPPWFAGHESVPFANRRALSDAERETLADWARTGAEPGDPDKAPAPPEPLTGKWQIGTPDLVLETGVIDLPARGDIPYRYAVLPHIFRDETWLQDVQILPDNPQSLHHCNMAFATLTEGFKEENFITGQVPGGEPMTLDPGVGCRIPKGALLVLQMHFVSTGKPEKCRVSVGFRYPRGVVDKQLRNMQLTRRDFAVPPGAPAHKVAASRTLEADAVGVGLFAHMHLRGKDMTFTAHPPAGKSEPLLVIPNYNFSWQIPYRWEPGQMKLAKGTKLECVAHFDNSSFNPYNPDPRATVRNGPQTHHEMMIGFFFYTHATEKLNLTIDAKTGRVKEMK